MRLAALAIAVALSLIPTNAPAIEPLVYAPFDGPFVPVPRPALPEFVPLSLAEPTGAPDDAAVISGVRHRIKSAAGAPPTSTAAQHSPSASAAPVSGQFTASGTASWYPRSRGWTIPHVALPGAHYTPPGQHVRSVLVTVFLPGEVRTGIFPVVDCLCGGIPGRVVDLSLGAVLQLGLDPSTGLWPVRVEAAE